MPVLLVTTKLLAERGGGAGAPQPPHPASGDAPAWG